jgi:hypothetical protein
MELIFCWRYLFIPSRFFFWAKGSKLSALNELKTACVPGLRMHVDTHNKRRTQHLIQWNPELPKRATQSYAMQLDYIIIYWSKQLIQKKKEHLQISSVSVPPSLEGPGRVIPDTPLCLGFCATRARRARAVVAAAASLDTSDPSGAFAVISDRCNLHRNEPGCVVGAHRQYLAGALVSEHGGAAAELMVNRSGLATGKREHGVLWSDQVAAWCVLYALVVAERNWLIVWGRKGINYNQRSDKKGGFSSQDKEWKSSACRVNDDVNRTKKCLG